MYAVESEWEKSVARDQQLARHSKPSSVFSSSENASNTYLFLLLRSQQWICRITDLARRFVVAVNVYLTSRRARHIERVSFKRRHGVVSVLERFDKADRAVVIFEIVPDVLAEGMKVVDRFGRNVIEVGRRVLLSATRDLHNETMILKRSQ